MKVIKNVSETRNQLTKLKSLFSPSSKDGSGPGKTHLIIISVTVLLALSTVYFYFYMEHEGEKFDNRRFRVLHTLETNITKKQSAYLKEVINIKKEYYSLIDSNRTVTQGFLDLMVKGFNEKINRAVITNAINNTEIPGYYFSGYLDDKILNVTRDTDTSAVKLGIFIRLDEYLNKLIPKKIFDNIIILEKDGSDLSVRYQDLPNKVLINSDSIKSIFDSMGGFYAGGISDMKYNGEIYRRYVHISNPKKLESQLLLKNYSGTFDFNSSQEIICGLVRYSTYQSSKQRVNIWWIILLSIFIVLTIVSLPLLKVYLISDVEQLKSGDVVLTGMSVIIGAPFALLIVLSLSEYIGYYTYEQEEDLRHFAGEIDSSFFKEVDRIYDQLNAFDARWIKEQETIGFSDAVQRLSERRLAQFSIYNHFNEFYGIKEGGKQSFSLSTYNSSKELLPLDERQYYKDLKQKSYWYIKDKVGNDIGPVVLEPVTSWTTSNHELIVGVPIEKNTSIDSRYLAISTQATSVMDPILRSGYGFAIIDNTGRTWFNSNLSRMNSENFLQEINFDSQIQTAIYGKQEAFTQATYWGDRKRMYITPSQHFPLFIVTFYEMQHARSFIAEISSMNMIYILMAFVLVGFLVLVTTLLDRRWRLFKFKSFAFDWLRPTENKSELYNLSIFHMLLNLIFFLLMMYGISEDSKGLWEMGPNIVAICLLYPSLIYLSNYWFHFQLQDDQSFKLKEYKLIIAHAFILCIYLLVLYAFVPNASLYITMVILWLVSTILCIGIVLLRKIKGEKFKRVLKGMKSGFDSTLTGVEAITGPTNSFDRRYLTYLFVWLVTSSLIPLFFMFTLSKSMEEVVYSKYELLNTAKSVDNKFLLLREEPFDRSHIQKKVFDYQFIENNSFYMDTIKVTDSETKQLPVQKTPPYALSVWENLIFSIRPRFHKSVSDSRSLILTKNKNRQWAFSTSGDTTNLFYQLKYGDSGLSMIKASTVFQGNDKVTLLGNLFNTNRPYYNIGISIVIILFLILISVIVRYLYFISFSIRFKNLEVNGKIENSNGPMFIICGSQHTKEIKKKKLENKVVDLDQLVSDILLKETSTERIKVIDEKLKSIPKLLIASRYPAEIVDAFETNAEDTSLERDRLVVYISQYQQVILNETDYVMTEMGEDTDILKDWKEQKQYFHYYKDVWESCSTREKYLLYDLAQDGFANTKNPNSVLYLMNKGILIWDKQLRLFSSGFRNFILTVIKRKEGKKLEREIAHRGSWRVTRFILLGIIAAVLIFIALGEPEFFNDFNTILTLIASIVTLFPIVGNLFSAEG